MKWKNKNTIQNEIVKVHSFLLKLFCHRWTEKCSERKKFENEMQKYERYCEPCLIWPRIIRWSTPWRKYTYILNKSRIERGARVMNFQSAKTLLFFVNVKLVYLPAHCTAFNCTQLTSCHFSLLFLLVCVSAYFNWMVGWRCGGHLVLSLSFAYH